MFGQGTQGFLVPSAVEGKKVQLYSPEYYGYCTVGGILSCGLTHTAVTPLDVVKCKFLFFLLLEGFDNALIIVGMF